MGGAQAPAHPAMARQEPIVEHCDAGNSATIGVGVKAVSSPFVQDLLENVASLSPANMICEASSKTNPRRNLAKDANILRSVLSPINGHKIGALRRSPVVVTRITGKENMPAHFYLRPRVAPAPPPTMSLFIRKAVQAMKEWDADIAQDPFWADV
ncbi:hypothetical protein FIBSPDRAFT_274472 [Athelia psychrophila]|uniref:Uncharacterized protein n=1 Tax=Athelia psychrophila TaxID=1759441 RepID=A0A166RAY9_9AGAM|nr:hypothetical protein FIBSPDRAFT_274472 [Fibularhizoctonia sp. CBS 109695]